MDALNYAQGCSVLDVTMEDTNGTTGDQLKNQLLDFEAKKGAVHDEMNRMKQLPTNSTYVSHRLRVLHKILQLMSAQVCANTSAFI